VNFKLGIDYLYMFSVSAMKRELYHGEFDPGSERTLAARLKHASRTVTRGNLVTSGERVSNA
jgi:hypothetical protein